MKIRSFLCVALPVVLAPTVLSAADMGVSLQRILHHESGIFDESAAEIVAFDPATNSLYVVNGATPSIDMMKLGGEKVSAATLTEAGTLALTEDETPNSVDVHEGVIAAAVAGSKKDGRPGKVVLFNSDGDRLNEVAVGYLPDMLTFTPDGNYILTANEGEPTDDMDPPGSVSIIDMSDGAKAATVMNVTFESFSADDAKKKGIRLFPDKTPEFDFEPEYIAVAPDGKTAFVALQEANALAVIDIESASLRDVVGLGTKDYSKPGNGFDPNDKDGKVNITNVPVLGMYMPDAIAAFEVDGETYIITANEGDAREEDERVKKAKIDGDALTDDEKKLLERLKISTIDGDTDDDGDIDVLHSYGARSVSIWGSSGTLISDTGDDFEQITARYLGINFNSTNDENKGENRSDDKGPEPEGVDIGVIGGKTYAFIGLERVGGIMVYDVSNPAKPAFVTYENNRDFSSLLDFSLPGDLSKAGDLGPEGVKFISAEDSPYDVPLLVVASEVSGTVTVYSVNEN
ncbi:MAG: choice-of-anchor I family protein [Alphaproteobacteria bacterium]